MGLMESLRGFDAGVMNDAAIRARALQRAEAEAAAAAQAERVKRYGGRDNQSLAPEVARLYDRLESGGYEPGSREAVIRQILAKAVGPTTAAVDPRTVVDQLQGPGRQEVLEYMASQRGPGVQAQALGAVRALNELLASKGTGGQAARAGLYSGIGAGTAMGTTAGAQGLMALIDYLQGSGQGEEPMA